MKPVSTVLKHAGLAFSHQTVHGGGSILALANPAAPNSTILLEKSSLAPDISFKDAGLEVYHKHALAQLLNGSWVHGCSSGRRASWPLSIFGWHDYEFYG